MRPALLLAALALLAAPAAARAPAPPDAPCDGTGAPVRVTVTGLKDRTGRLKLELWPANDADFLKDDRDLRKEGKFFARIWAPVPAAGAVDLCIRAPGPGRYGMVFTHDRDGKNKFDIWKDGVGIASNQPIGRSRPRLAQSTITVGAGGASVTVRTQYLRGLSGFSPAAD